MHVLYTIFVSLTIATISFIIFLILHRWIEPFLQLFSWLVCMQSRMLQMCGIMVIYVCWPFSQWHLVDIRRKIWREAIKGKITVHPESYCRVRIRITSSGTGYQSQVKEGRIALTTTIKLIPVTRLRQLKLDPSVISSVKNTRSLFTLLRGGHLWWPHFPHSNWVRGLLIGLQDQLILRTFSTTSPPLASVQSVC